MCLTHLYSCTQLDIINKSIAEFTDIFFSNILLKASGLTEIDSQI